MVQEPSGQKQLSSVGWAILAAVGVSEATGTFPVLSLTARPAASHSLLKASNKKHVRRGNFYDKDRSIM